MAKQPEEKISRRLGRVELLLVDLAQLPDGYQPTEREAEIFGKLAAKITAVYAPRNYEASLQIEDIGISPEFAEVFGMPADATRAEVMAAAQNLVQELGGAKKQIEELARQATQPEASAPKPKTENGKPKTGK